MAIRVHIKPPTQWSAIAFVCRVSWCCDDGRTNPRLAVFATLASAIARRDCTRCAITSSRFLGRWPQAVSRCVVRRDGTRRNDRGCTSCIRRRDRSAQARALHERAGHGGLLASSRVDGRMIHRTPSVRKGICETVVLRCRVLSRSSRLRCVVRLRQRCLVSCSSSRALLAARCQRCSVRRPANLRG